MSHAAGRLFTSIWRNMPRTRLMKGNSHSFNTIRLFTCYPRHFCSTPLVSTKKEFVEVTFETADGTTFTVQGKEGDNLLDVVVNNDVDLDGFGACEGTLSCSTCHLIFKKEDFDKIEDPCTDEELDMLDLAYGLTDTSRLGCQVCLTKAMKGLKVKVPEGTADARQI